MVSHLKERINKIDEERRGFVIHIHGGGFIAMSSGSHQNYTRMWANDTGVPILSIDYRLSPKY